MPVSLSTCRNRAYADLEFVREVERTRWDYGSLEMCRADPQQLVKKTTMIQEHNSVPPFAGMALHELVTYPDFGVMTCEVPEPSRTKLAGLCFRTVSHRCFCPALQDRILHHTSAFWGATSGVSNMSVLQYVAMHCFLSC